MKRYSWIFALIMALTMAFVFTGCPADDDGGDDTSTTTTSGLEEALPSLEGDGFKLNLVNQAGVATPQTVTVIPNAGAEVGYADDNSSYIYTYGTDADMNYGNAIAYFKVTLPVGEELGDYEKVTFKWKAYNGDVMKYKNLFLLATKTKSEIEPPQGDPEIAALFVNTDGTIGDSDAPKMNKEDKNYVDVTLPIKFKKSLTGDIYFAFYVHAIDGSFEIKDLAFRQGIPLPVESVAYTGPTTWLAGVDLLLKGAPTPSNARYTEMEWTVKDAGTTGATIANNVLTTTAAGKVSLTVFIANGKLTEDYEDDFDDVITIIEPPTAADTDKTTFVGTYTSGNVLGFGGLEGDLDVELFKTGKYLVCAFWGGPNDLTGWGGLQLVIQAPGDGWKWNQSQSADWTNFDNSSGGLVYLVVDISSLVKYDEIVASMTGDNDKAKIIFNAGFNNYLVSWITTEDINTTVMTDHSGTLGKFYITKDPGIFE